MPSDLHRVPATVSLSRLIGGLDLAATLRQGRPVLEQGLRPSRLLRLPKRVVSRLRRQRDIRFVRLRIPLPLR